MTRNPAAENAALRHRLRTVEEALRVAVAALSADADPAREWLVSHLSDTLKPPGGPEAPAPNSREPAAGNPHTGGTPHG